MVVVELPKPDIYDIEILVAEEVGIEVDVRLRLDVEERLEDVGALELAEAHLVVVFPVGHVEHPVDHAQRIPLLELRSVLQEVQPRVKLQDLLK